MKDQDHTAEGFENSSIPLRMKFSRTTGIAQANRNWAAWRQCGLASRLATAVTICRFPQIAIRGCQDGASDGPMGDQSLISNSLLIFFTVRSINSCIALFVPARSFASIRRTNFSIASRSSL